MTGPLALMWDLIARDQASPAFLRVAGAADKAATATERTSAKLAGATASMSKLGATLTKSVTVPMLGIAAVSVDQAAKFQKSMTLLQTAGGETADKMTAISAGIKKTAIDTGTSLSQLNQGMYTVAKFGSKFSATDQLLILKAAAEGAKAENVDLGVATDALTTVMQSYGLKASDAVATQNELVVAAGKSKTTMTDFASSLSNVVPLASSLGISFDQVGGAIATMTQHGETAQQSTDNLNNLIRNLAGQNNVASAAMQQLGINTLDLRKNLAKNGLTGTLQTVEDALARSSKAGLVVVDTFKQAQLATGSLHTMLGVMTGDLQKQSEGLLKGSTSIKDYRTYARSLGGEAGAAALQFLGLYQQTLGFNNALKSGNGDVSTAAAQLQKMLGGATGLNVALMLGGNSAKTFTANAAAISAAAQQGGTDIATWAKTQDTLAVKTDQAKERLQVMAVDIGDKLLPVAEDLVKDVSGIVNWFSHLSTGTQGVILKVGLLGAALGPVLAVGSKLITMFSRMVTAAQIAGSAIATQFVNTSGAGATAALVEARSAATFTEAEVTKAEAVAVAARKIAQSETQMTIAGRTAAQQAAVNAEVFAAAKRAEAAAAATTAEEVRAAAISEGESSSLALGPIGLAVGAVALVGAGVIEMFRHNSDAARKYSQDQIRAMADAKQALVDQKEAISEIGQAWDADRYKLGQYSIAAVANALDKQRLTAAYIDSKGGVGYKTSTPLNVAVDLGIDRNLVAKSAIDPASKAQLAKLINGQISEANKTVAGYQAQFQAGYKGPQISAAQDLSARARYTTLVELAKALQITSGTATTAIRQQDALAETEGKAAFATRTVAQQAELYGNSLRAATVAGTANMKFIGEHITAIDKNKKSLNANTVSLYNQMVQQRYNAASVVEMIAKYGKVPSSIYTKALLDTNAATDKARIIQAEINAIKQGKVPGIGVNTAHGRKVIDDLQTRLDSLKQGLIPWITVKDRATAILDGILTRMGKIRGAQIIAKVSETQDLASQHVPAHAAGGSIADGWFTVGEQGYELGHKSGSNVHIFSNAMSKAMTGTTSLPGYAAGTSASTDLAKALTAIAAAISKSSATSDDLKTAVSDLTAAAKAARLSSSRLAALSKDQGVLLADAAKRDQIAAKLGTNSAATAQTAFDILNTAKDAFSNEVSTVTQAIRGGFNILTAGGGGTGGAASFDATYLNAAANVQAAAKFKTELAKLGPEFGQSTAGKELLQQLAEGGIANAGAEVDALAAATQSQIDALVKQQAELDKLANETAVTAAKTLNQAQIEAAQKVVTALESLKAVLTAHIDTIGRQVAAALNTTARTSSTHKSTIPAGR